jgi:hypothetical protein
LRPALLALIALAAPAVADPAADLAHRLADFHSPAPIAASVRLELHLERVLHHEKARGDASVPVEVLEDAGGLRVQWDAAVLRRADAEEGERDLSAQRLTPVREALKELDPDRVSHLLDQARTLSGLTRGVPAEETVDSYEGREARRLVYRFQPRLSWTESYYLHHSEGRFTVWIAADGTPLASDSVATFDGKTSRMFGRFHGSTTIHTRYAADGGRLWVAERDLDDLRSREDDSEVEHRSERFVLTRR